MHCPCDGCPKAGCGSHHDVCPDYIAFKEWKAEVNKQKAKDQTVKDLPRACKTAYWKSLKHSRA